MSSEIVDPPSAYERLVQTEYFHMERLEAIFVALAPMLESRGKIQFYKAADIAEAIENELQRWDKSQFLKPPTSQRPFNEEG